MSKTWPSGRGEAVHRTPLEEARFWLLDSGRAGKKPESSLKEERNPSSVLLKILTSGRVEMLDCWQLDGGFLCLPADLSAVVGGSVSGRLGDVGSWMLVALMAGSWMLRPSKPVRRSAVGEEESCRLDCWFFASA